MESDIIDKIIMKLLQYKLDKLRRNNMPNRNTPYIFIKGTGKDYPKYAMYTDDEKIRNSMHGIL